MPGLLGGDDDEDQWRAPLRPVQTPGDGDGGSLIVPGQDQYSAPGAGLADLYRGVMDRIAQQQQRALDEGVWTGEQAWEGGHPTAKGVAEAGREMAGNLVGDIKAYHGSPHDFSAFDTSKIGTGEGAQAYGHGLYFAGNEGVARGYRDDLTPQPPPSTLIKVNGVALSDLPEFQALNQRARGNVSAAMTFNPDKAGWLNHVQQVLDWRGNPGVPLSDADIAKRDAIYRPGLEFLKTIDPSDVTRVDPPKGHMYEVNLGVEPEHLLDWDKPLSEQSPIVQQKIANLSARGIAPRNPDPMATGGEIYQELMHKAGSSANVAALLREPVPGTNVGVRGVQYLDAGSRAAGEGTRNYVMFDDKLIDIIRKYGIAGLMGGGGAAGLLGNAGEEQQ